LSVRKERKLPLNLVIDKIFIIFCQTRNLEDICQRLFYHQRFYFFF